MVAVTYPSRALGAAGARARAAARGRLRLPPARRAGGPRRARRGQRDGRRRRRRRRRRSTSGSSGSPSLVCLAIVALAAQPASRARRRGRDRRRRPRRRGSPRCPPDCYPGRVSARRASASISTSRLGSIRRATSTSVAAGRIVAEDLAVDGAHLASQREMSVTNIRVRTTSARRTRPRRGRAR